MFLLIPRWGSLEVPNYMVYISYGQSAHAYAWHCSDILLNLFLCIWWRLFDCRTHPIAFWLQFHAEWWHCCVWNTHVDPSRTLNMHCFFISVSIVVYIGLAESWKCRIGCMSPSPPIGWAISRKCNIWCACRSQHPHPWTLVVLWSCLFWTLLLHQMHCFLEMPDWV